jgi:hypothetical protein
VAVLAADYKFIDNKRSYCGKIIWELYYIKLYEIFADIDLIVAM